MSRTKCTYSRYNVYNVCKSRINFQLFDADERLEKFVLRASGLGLISSMKLDDRKDIHSVKSTRQILHSELKARILSPLQGK